MFDFATKGVWHPSSSWILQLELRYPTTSSLGKDYFFKKDLTATLFNNLLTKICHLQKVQIDVSDC